MKKFFALILALVMMTALSVPAFAEEPTATGSAEVSGQALQNKDITVYGKYTLPAAGKTYDVDISWNGMIFEYTAVPVWDPDKGATVEASGSWTTNEGSITVTNNSNAKIYATLSFEKENDVNVVGKFNDTLDSVTLALNEKVGDIEVKDTASFKITEGKIDDDVTIGTIKVTLSAENPNPAQ